MKRGVRAAAGIGLIVLGIIGGFLPVIQGWVFILGGLSLLAPRHRLVRRARVFVKTRLRRR